MSQAESNSTTRRTFLALMSGASAAGAVSTAANAASDFERAQVKSFDKTKGFGFLSRGTGTRDIFVHMITLRLCGMPALAEGQLVQVRYHSGPRGLQAIEIKPDNTLEPDPIFAAIERLEAAHRDFDAVLDEQSVLERLLPCKRRMTHYIDEIVDADDQRWIDNQLRVDALGDIEEERAYDLLRVQPTTVAGLATLLRFAYRWEAELGREWPGSVPVCHTTKGYEVPWLLALHKLTADALEALALR